MQNYIMNKLNEQAEWTSWVNKLKLWVAIFSSGSVRGNWHTMNQT